ncbi:hypothetical protein [Asanoa siamensis]|uniref:Uncharacterized protein n=1 Tax=Asanoa siamensis TaxID=926357 RepID=A0ABQ4CNN6_9ACTN|nr:hypothetical protein [Asanoa siamensis]GIF72904.1 hypothetical protein Asi02nite_24220 [Asanoa siamensis]
MAYRTWGRVLLAALGVGLLAGAGQLGFAYGLGVVRFARDFAELPGQWTAHLAWVAWFAMLAAVAGGLAGNWLARRDGLRMTLGAQVAVSVAGGVGALAVAPLAMLPARVAGIASGNAVTIAGLSAALGALVGVFAAVAVLAQRVAGLNLGAVTLVVWLVALLSVAPSLGPEDPLPEVRLGVLDAAWLGDGLAQRLAVIAMPAIALLAGAGIGALARWRGLPLIPVAVSGVVGPALLALAYLIAGPGDDPDRYQAAPYWGALIAVAAGGLGSVLAAVARQLTAGDRGGSTPPAPRHGDHTAEIFPSTRPGADDASPTRAGDFDAWGNDKPPSDRGDDDSTSALGGASPGFGVDVPGPRRARDLGDVERAAPQPEEGSLFTSPTPVAPLRQPEIVSPPPGPEPTPIRPFDRQPASGPGDWLTDKTSTFPSASVPVVPAAGPGVGGDAGQRPTSIRPQPPASGQVPRQSDGPDGRTDTPERSWSSRGGAAASDWSSRSTPASDRTAGSDWSFRLDPTPVDDQAGGSDWSGGPGSAPATGRSPKAASDAPAASGPEMPDWRLAPPAWTPPPPITPGAPAAETSSIPQEPTPVPQPEKPQKRRGLFRRKDKSAPEPTPPAPDAGGDDWVEVPPAPGPDTDPPAADTTPRGPRGFGFGGLVSNRFGDDSPATDRDGDRRGDGDRSPTDDRTAPASWSDRTRPTTAAGDSAATATSWSDRARPNPGEDDSAAPTSWSDRARPTSAAGDSAATATSWSDRGRPSAATGADQAPAASWSNRNRPGGSADPATDDSAAAAGPSDRPAKERRPGRAERHLRSVDSAGDQPKRPRAAVDSDAGSWDIDDPVPPTRGIRPAASAGADTKASEAPDADTPSSEDTEATTERAPSRGLFRRSRNNSDTTETRDEPGDKPEPTKGRRGKSEKPIEERDEEYVDWVAGLGAPEPVNERRRDDAPRRSLRPTGRGKDE